MEIETMGKVAVAVAAKIESLDDLFRADRGELSKAEVRTVEVNDALVDTGATILAMPKPMIEHLGLKLVRTRQARTAAGPVTVNVYGTARLTIEGRDCPTDVSEIPDDCPILIGQVPLELLDFVVDPRQRKLIGNPAHGGEHILEMD